MTLQIETMKTFMRPLQLFAPPRFFSGSRLIGAPFVRQVALCFALCSVVSVSLAQTSAVNSPAAATEERVKAAFLYKFLNYVDWPPASFEKSESPYVIGVINADDIADELSRISAGHSVNNRSVTVKRLGAGDPLNGVHVLFIGKAERARLPQLLKQSQQYVLDVTETEGALAQGSMINFRLADNRVRFEVSLDAVEKADLKLSSRMLAVAIAVIKGGQQ
jgi:hypothetical protein